MRSQPLIAVSDVEASSRWYQRLLDCQSAHGGAEYERLVANGALILQLHRFGVEHDHGPIGDPHDKPYGNGLLLWFEVDDFDAAIARAIETQGGNHQAASSAHWGEALAMLVTRSRWLHGRAFQPGWYRRVSGKPNLALWQQPCEPATALLLKYPAPFRMNCWTPLTSKWRATMRKKRRPWNGLKRLLEMWPMNGSHSAD